MGPAPTPHQVLSALDTLVVSPASSYAIRVGRLRAGPTVSALRLEAGTRRVPSELDPTVRALVCGQEALAALREMPLLTRGGAPSGSNLKLPLAAGGRWRRAAARQLSSVQDQTVSSLPGCCLVAAACCWRRR